MKLVHRLALFIFFTFCLLSAVNAGAPPPVPSIPPPSLTMAKALEIATTGHKEPDDFILISADWAKASTFTPRVSDGATYSTMKDDPDGYSWFFTYVRDKRHFNNKTPMEDYFGFARVTRIKDNGKAGLFIGFH